MKYILIILVLLIVSPVQAADTWTDQDIALEATWLVLQAVDYSQTKWMHRHGWKWGGENYRETNPLMGNRPDSARIDTVFAVGTIVQIAVTHYLPAEYRPYWQGGLKNVKEDSANHDPKTF